MKLRTNHKLNLTIKPRNHLRHSFGFIIFFNNCQTSFEVEKIVNHLVIGNKFRCID